MAKVKILVCKYAEDKDYGMGAHCRETLLDPNVKEESKKERREIYHAQNLNECPEDAILARDILDAYGAIDLIMYGMRLANDGYDAVAVDWQREEY